MDGVILLQLCVYLRGKRLAYSMGSQMTFSGNVSGCFWFLGTSIDLTFFLHLFLPGGIMLAFWCLVYSLSDSLCFCVCCFPQIYVLFSPLPDTLYKLCCAAALDCTLLTFQVHPAQFCPVNLSLEKCFMKSHVQYFSLPKTFSRTVLSSSYCLSLKCFVSVLSACLCCFFQRTSSNCVKNSPQFWKEICSQLKYVLMSTDCTVLKIFISALVKALFFPNLIFL